MTQDKIKRIHQWYSWILSAVLVVLGVLVILSCLDIYTSGPRPYSSDAIALRFHRIIVPVLIAFSGIVGGIALNIFIPLKSTRSKAVSAPREIMQRLRQKAGIPPVQKEVRLRLVLRIITGSIFVTLMIYPLAYFLNPVHFTVSDLNADVVRAVLISLLPAVAGLALCWGCRILVNASYRREAAACKQALAEGHRATNNPAINETPKCRCAILTGVRTTVIAIAVIFIVIGIFNGGAEDVLKKAIAICTECIGLG